MGCDQSLCANLHLRASPVSEALQVIHQSSPQTDWGGWGFCHYHGPFEDQQCECNPTTHLTAGLLLGMVAVGSWVGLQPISVSLGGAAPWAPNIRATLCECQYHSSPWPHCLASAWRTGPPPAPGGRCARSYPAKLVSRIAEHPARCEGNRRKRGQKKILKAVRIFRPAVLHAVIRYSQSLSFEIWIYFLTVYI